MFERLLICGGALALGMALSAVGADCIARRVRAVEPPTEAEREHVYRLRAACRHDGPHTDVFALLRLVRLEEELGIDRVRPGLLGAVWCVEAGFRLESRRGGPVRGDYRDGVPMAHGPFQLWPTARAACGASGGAADDLEWSARCWVARVLATLPKARRRCPQGNVWMVSEAAVSNVRKYAWDCKRGSEHWRLAVRALE
jgi:hypothetical protein